MSIESDLHDIAVSFVRLADAFDRAFPKSLPRPQPLTINLKSERRENDMDIWTIDADLPAVPSGTDIVSQQLTITVDDVARDTVAIDLAATVTPEFEAPENSHVKLSLVYVDNAGNFSPAREQEFEVIDTVPPDAPGEFGEIRLKSERTEPDA